MRKAEKLEEVYRVFKATPLEIDDLDFYVSVSDARGNLEPRSRIARLLLSDQSFQGVQHILFVGYRGCGKSTELNHLQKDIEKDYLSLSFSVQSELDSIHLNFIELYIITMELLFRTAADHKLAVRPEYIQNITHWLMTKEIEEIREKYIGAEGEIGAGTNIDLPWLVNFFAKFKMSSKTSNSLKETLKKNIEPKLSELIFHCNTLITEIRNQLDKIGKKDLLLIIEDLDKIPLNRASDLFFTHVNQLVLLKTNIIFTFPVALYYHIKFRSIRSYFNEVFELPMVKVREKNQDPSETGIAGMTRIIEKRMDLGLFDDEALLRQLILDSGGCFRDLFLMIQEASQIALDGNRQKIIESDCRSAFTKLKKEYDASIADFTLDGVKYTASGYYDTLVALATDETKKPENTNEVLHLRQNLCILGYNGEGWCDVHPIVRAILKERNKL